MRIHPALLDVIFVLVTYFISSTVLLLAYADQQPEVTLPSLELAETKVSSGQSGSTELKTVTLSIKRSGDDYGFYLDQDSLSIKELRNRLSQAKPRQVSLRVGKNVVHEVENQIFSMLIEVGIPEVNFVGISNGKVNGNE